MKLLISFALLFALGACNKDDNKSPAPVGGNNPKDGFLTASEQSTFENTTWCQDDTTVSFSWEHGSFTKYCSTQITVRHNVTKFSDDEFFVELSYVGERVRCQPSWGDSKSFDQEEVSEALGGNSYRISMTEKNLALMTKVGEGNESTESEIFITNQDVKIAPVDKNLKPTVLYRCN